MARMNYLTIPQKPNLTDSGMYLTGTFSAGPVYKDIIESWAIIWQNAPILFFSFLYMMVCSRKFNQLIN